MAGNPSIAASLHHSTAPTWFGLIFGSWVGLVWGSLISLPVGIGAIEAAFTLFGGFIAVPVGGHSGVWSAWRATQQRC